MSADNTYTYAWACETSGALTDAQRRAMKAAIRRSYFEIAKSVVAWPLHRSPRDTQLPIAPDSKLAVVAEEAAAEQSAALVGHGYRTWCVGYALAEQDRISLDAELFYAASLLHDSGMMREVVGEDFTIRSAHIVLEVCERDEATDPVSAARLADAVVAHASAGLTPRDDPIAFYVQAGALADLAGLRMWDLPRGYLRAAYEAHPAHGVHGEIQTLIRREAHDVPQGRFALLRRAGLDRMVQLSPTRRYA
jgi:hypothetical protein